MKLYTGKRISGNKVEVLVDGVVLSPEPSRQIRDHSPDGFEWGYGGSGPCQLALAILLDLYGERIARGYYYDFKTQFILTAEQEGFVISSDDVDRWLKKAMLNDEKEEL